MDSVVPSESCLSIGRGVVHYVTRDEQKRVADGFAEANLMDDRGYGSEHLDQKDDSDIASNEIFCHLDSGADQITCAGVSSNQESDDSLGSKRASLGVIRKQRPRSIRSSNGTKKTTWGSMVLEMVSYKGKSRERTCNGRTFRKPRKRKHMDMALEGDIEWEAVTGESRTHGTGKTLHIKDSVDVLFGSALVVNGEYAAVMVGLQACKPGPAERVHFKDVLKRRGGVQEYLECRNLILGLWEKDLCHILSIADCGVCSPAAEDESPRITLLRDIYDFLNYHGYINMGIAMKKVRKALLKHYVESERPKEVPVGLEEYSIFPNLCSSVKEASTVTLVCENELVQQDIDQSTLLKGHNLKLIGNGIRDKPDESSLLDIKNRLKSLSKRKFLLSSEAIKKENEAASLELTDMSLEFERETVSRTVFDSNGEDAGACTEMLKFDTSIETSNSDSVVVTSDQESQVGHKKVIIVGAGPAGLAAGRHLERMDVEVIILEARDRVGGRVWTDRRTFSGPVDLGASIITGVEADVATERRPDPSALVCKQLNLELTTLHGDCPLFDSVTGSKVHADIDVALEAEYNSLLDETVVLVARTGDVAMQMSLEDGLELLLKERCTDVTSLSIHGDKVKERGLLLTKTGNHRSLERRVLDWHFANLEYGCAAELKNVSLPYWNQDDVYGGFGGPHCMIKGGYSTVMEALGYGLNIILGQEVTQIEYSVGNGRIRGKRDQVRVHTKNGTVHAGDAVLVTIPLGCLKANMIDFLPPLPDWKKDSIQRLGFGVLNKVVMEFTFAFWDENVDYFGATAESPEIRGRCFMFWNLKRTVGSPILIALVVGQAAIAEEENGLGESVGHAVGVLRKLFGEATVPEPIAFAVTKWGCDPFSRGAYSYVAVGASGEDYDILGRPVENCVFFAGEATCKEHPDTVGGAMMSGLREAVRITDVFYNKVDSMVEAEAMAASLRQTDVERNEVRDMTKRLTAAELSNAIWKDGGKARGNGEPFSRSVLLEDMFRSAKTTSGRLLLAKEMLQLPVSSLRSFAGTKGGLSVLNDWIQDSMGKDGTQLLRHCVRLLLVVGTDLSSVRESGIGRTVKEKVVVHTSRDIRAVASQLVKLWVEAFRREKAAGLIAKPASFSLRKQGDATLLQKAAFKPGNKSVAQKVKLPEYPSTNGGDTFSKEDEHVPRKCSKDKCSMDGMNKGITPTYKEPGNSTQNLEQAGVSQREEAIAAAKAAADVCAKVDPATALELPEILSFNRFAKREYTATSDSNKRKSLEREVLLLHAKDQITSGIDARNCRVRDWSIDFSDSCSYLGSPSLFLAPSLRAGVGDDFLPKFSSLSSLCTESALWGAQTLHPQIRGSELDDMAPSSRDGADNISASSSVKGFCGSRVPLYSGMASLKSGNVSIDGATYEKSHRRETHMLDNSVHISPNQKRGDNDYVPVSKPVNQQVGGSTSSKGSSEDIKRALTDYVAQLLTPLYKTRRLDRDNFKAIVKKATGKVMERRTEQEMSMDVAEFLDTRRKIKIRSLVDKFVERYLESVR